MAYETSESSTIRAARRAYALLGMASGAMDGGGAAYAYTSGHREWRLYSEVECLLLSISQEALAGRIAPYSGHCFDDLRQASSSRRQDKTSARRKLATYHVDPVETTATIGGDRKARSGSIDIRGSITNLVKRQEAFNCGIRHTCRSSRRSLGTGTTLPLRVAAARACLVLTVEAKPAWWLYPG